MNLSRAAKKFRDQMPKEAQAPKPAPAKNEKLKNPPAPVPTPAPQPVAPVEPTPEPVATTPVETVETAAEPVAEPKKAWPEKVKRPRFVREKAEKRERPAGPALPPRSTKLAAQLLTKNLFLPPSPETPKTGR